MKLNSPSVIILTMPMSVDDFLGGLVKIAQPLKGYRGGVDPVLLAASIPAKAGETVLELGVWGRCGLPLSGAACGGIDADGRRASRNLRRSGASQCGAQRLDLNCCARRY